MDRTTRPLREKKPQKPSNTSAFISPFLWFDWACAWLAYGLSNIALFRVLEYAGKATVLVGVLVWIFGASQREQADRRLAWSVVNSKGGCRREALEHLYKNKVDLRGLYGEGGYFGDIDLHGADVVWADRKS